jgi:hypothetical protein
MITQFDGHPDVVGTNMTVVKMVAAFGDIQCRIISFTYSDKSFEMYSTLVVISVKSEK